MDSSEQKPKSGPLRALGEAVGFIGAGLGALITGWPNRRRQQEIAAPPSDVAEPGDPGPVLEALEALGHKTEKTAPYPVND